MLPLSFPAGAITIVPLSCAYVTAFNDNRFPALKPKEAGQLKIEVFLRSL